MVKRKRGGKAEETVSEWSQGEEGERKKLVKEKNKGENKEKTENKKRGKIEGVKTLGRKEKWRRRPECRRRRRKVIK